MSEKRLASSGDSFVDLTQMETVDLLNKLSDENTKLHKKVDEQQEFIEELQVSDEMGWKRAEHFEKKCPKELHNKKMYIKRLEYKVQKFKEMNGEQQATIQSLKEENASLKQRIRDIKYNNCGD